VVCMPQAAAQATVTAPAPPIPRAIDVAGVGDDVGGRGDGSQEASGDCNCWAVILS
jgi:hypothetical protein